MYSVVVFRTSFVRISAETRNILTAKFRRFSLFFQTNVRLVCQLRNDRFLPNPFRFIIHLSSRHSTLYSRRCQRRRNLIHQNYFFVITKDETLKFS